MNAVANMAGPRSKWRAWVVACLGTLLLGGCGPDYPQRAPVSGKVTFNGQLVTQGTITFYPENGRSALGKIQPDGTYWLTTFDEGDGAVLGHHRVTIKATEVSGPAGPASFEEEMAMSQSKQPAGQATVKWLVPQEFSQRDSSPLTAEVQAGRNTIDFALPLAK